MQGGRANRLRKEVDVALSTHDRQSTPTEARPDLTIRTEPDADTVAHALRPLLVALLGEDPPVRIELWDGSAFGPVDSVGTITVRSPDALRRMVWAPGELGMARAYVA